MWWIGNLPEDELVYGSLNQLDQLTGGGDGRPVRGLPPGLLGYGAAFLRGRRVPLLVVDERRDPRPEYWIRGSGVLPALIRRRLRHYDLPIPHWLFDVGGVPGAIEDPRAAGVAEDQAPRRLLAQLRLLTAARIRQRALDPQAGLVDRGLAVPLEMADAETRTLAESVGLTWDTLVSYWPRPVATSARLHGVSRKPEASAGMHVERANHSAVPQQESYLATAGHFDIPAAGPVFRSRRWPFRGVLLGSMRTRFDPGRPAQPQFTPAIGAVDLGLIELTSNWLDRCPTAPESPGDVREYDVYRWHGAAGGPAVGEVVGPLRLIEVQGQPLAHCWYLSGASRGGDSGAAVVHRISGRLLGQIVGTRGGDAGGGKRTGTIVQDVQLHLAAAAGALDCAPADLTLSVLDPL